MSMMFLLLVVVCVLSQPGLRHCIPIEPITSTTTATSGSTGAPSTTTASYGSSSSTKKPGESSIFAWMNSLDASRAYLSGDPNIKPASLSPSTTPKYTTVTTTPAPTTTTAATTTTTTTTTQNPANTTGSYFKFIVNPILKLMETTTEAPVSSSTTEAVKTTTTSTSASPSTTTSQKTLIPAAVPTDVPASPRPQDPYVPSVPSYMKMEQNRAILEAQMATASWSKDPSPGGDRQTQSYVPDLQQQFVSPTAQETVPSASGSQGAPSPGPVFQGSPFPNNGPPSPGAQSTYDNRGPTMVPAPPAFPASQGPSPQAQYAMGTQGPPPSLNQGTSPFGLQPPPPPPPPPPSQNMFAPGIPQPAPQGYPPQVFPSPTGYPPQGLPLPPPPPSPSSPIDYPQYSQGQPIFNSFGQPPNLQGFQQGGPQQPLGSLPSPRPPLYPTLFNPGLQQPMQTLPTYPFWGFNPFLPSFNSPFNYLPDRGMMMGFPSNMQQDFGYDPFGPVDFNGFSQSEVQNLLGDQDQEVPTFFSDSLEAINMKGPISGVPLLQLPQLPQLPQPPPPPSKPAEKYDNPNNLNGAVILPDGKCRVGDGQGSCISFRSCGATGRKPLGICDNDVVCCPPLG